MPKGAGSYHWVARTREQRDFLTVDDLGTKPSIAAEPDETFDGLARAYGAASMLEERRGVSMAVGPIRTKSGPPLARLSADHSLAVFPFVEGVSGNWGDRLDPHSKGELVRGLARLHGADPAGLVLSARPLGLPERGELEASLDDVVGPWAGGPFSEQAREALATAASRVRDRLEELEELGDRLAARPGRRTSDCSTVSRRRRTAPDPLPAPRAVKGNLEVLLTASQRAANIRGVECRRGPGQATKGARAEDRPRPPGTNGLEGGAGMTDDLDHETTWPRSVSAGAFDDLVTIKLHSCHSTWYFQPVRMRFRREPKGIGIPGVSTGWRPYYGLRFADNYDGFTVCLDREGTRWLRARLHPAGSDACPACNVRRARTEDDAPDGRRPQAFAVPFAP